MRFLIAVLAAVLAAAGILYAWFCLVSYILTFVPAGEGAGLIKVLLCILLFIVGGGLAIWTTVLGTAAVFGLVILILKD